MDSNHMTDEQRAQLMGNELTQAVDELTTCWPLSDAQHDALGNLLAAALGRVTSLAASAAVEKYQLIDRVGAVEARMATLEAREAGRE